VSKPRDFGAKGDGKTDDTRALQHAIARGDGRLVLPQGDYLISRPLIIRLATWGRFALTGQGGIARLIMAGAGPALHLVGTHRGTADPDSVAEGVWAKERLATVDGVEIVGRHSSADGLLLEGCMQPTLTRLLIRRCRHGIHLRTRDRNVLVSDCHVYDNAGVGIFLDRVNLHQVNIHGNHVSYCKRAGILVAGSQVRNIQIVGNDIEYNYDAKTEGCADVLFDAREGTIREGTIVGNTIQAKESPGGANVRLLGAADSSSAVGLLTITGNLIGSQESAIHLSACRGVVVSGNNLYSGYRHALRAEDSDHLVVTGNSIDHNPDYRGKSTDQVVLRNCRHVSFTGNLCQHTRESEAAVEATLEVRDCDGVNITGCQFVHPRTRGVWLAGSKVVRIAECSFRAAEEDKAFRASVAADGKSRQVVVANNFVSKGTDGAVILPAEVGTASANTEV
jgi:polygalacturonase